MFDILIETKIFETKIFAVDDTKIIPNTPEALGTIVFEGKHAVARDGHICTTRALAAAINVEAVKRPAVDPTFHALLRTDDAILTCFKNKLKIGMKQVQT